ncbi:MAG: chorismate mutase [Helicobacteraceae bacterium]|nr:chorismate mutase [Helicobacteraceae bacterium]
MALIELRKKIDAIDDRILAALEDRMSLVKEIGAIKKKDSGTIYRPAREKEILSRLGAHKGLLARSAIEAIFREIFAASRQLEQEERVAFLGPEGSFSHQAAESRFGATSEYLPMQTIGAVFKAVESRRAKYGVAPISNNLSGLVGDTIDCLEKSDLLIVGDMELSIHHSFATKAEHLAKIKRVYSKDVAFGQCRAFFSDHNLSVEMIPVESTAKAARLAADDAESAAICSVIAAKLNELPVMFENIEDSHDNRTRFAIVSDFHNSASRRDLTTILARTPHKPGALFALLKEFNDAQINLTMIESIPSHISKNQTLFFIDFEGHRDDPAIKAILDGRKNEIKWLGSYARN